MTAGAAARLALPLSLVAALLGGCRGGIGSTCRCAADCRSGLVCSAEGEKPLTDELCYKPGVSGLCAESDDIEDSGAPVELTEPPTYLDMPSKRDFQPSGSVSDSATSVATEPTTSTGTGTTTSTGTSTAATDTGTTDTSTGTSTGDTSTGSSSTTSTSSSSSGSSGSSTSTTDSSSGSSSSTT